MSDRYLTISTIEFTTALFTILLLGFVFSQYKHSKYRCLALIGGITSEIVALLSDALLYVTHDSPWSTIGSGVKHTAIFLDFLSGYFLTFFIAYYIIVVIRSHTKVAPFYIWYMRIMVTFGFILLIYTQFSTGLYYFDSANHLNMTSLQAVNTIIYLTNLIILFVMVIHYRQSLSLRDFIALLSYCFVIAITMVYDILTGDIVAEYLGTTIALFIVSIANTNEIAEDLVENTQKLTEAKEKQAADEIKLLNAQLVEKDIHMAAKIQTDSLPNQFPPFTHHPDIDLYASMNAAKAVGGDLYDYFEIDENHACVVIADVSGKGIPASLFMMQTKISIRSQAMNCPDTAQIMNCVNHLLSENNTQKMFATAWIGILDTENLTLQYTNAGHNPPAFARDGEHFKFLKKTHGPALGISPEIQYEKSNKSLLAGDTLYLYTDGVTEAKNTAGEMYKEERLLSVLDQSIQHPTAKEIEEENSHSLCKDALKCIKISIDEFVKDAEQFDDITMLMMKI